MTNLFHFKDIHNNVHLRFRDLSPELVSLFVRRTAMDLFMSMIMILGCFYFRSMQLTILILIAVAIMNVMNLLFYFQLTRGRLNILDAVCENVKVSNSKFMRSDSKVELLLKNDKYYYTINTSKNMAKNISENMRVRVYVTNGNAYKKNDEQVVILNPILIAPLVK